MGPVVDYHRGIQLDMDDETQRYFDLAFAGVSSKIANLERKLEDEAVSRRKHQQRYSEQLQQSLIMIQKIQSEFSLLKEEFDEHTKSGIDVRDQVIQNTAFRKSIRVVLTIVLTSVVGVLAHIWWE